MADPDFTIDKAQIVGLFLEAVLFGIFLVSFFPCISALLFQPGFKRRQKINWAMVIIAFLLATFATMDVAFGLLHNIQAFILYQGPGGAIEEFSDLSNWVNVMKSVDIFMAIVIGDGVLIYRCWVVYGRSWLAIAFPLLIWAGTTACASVLTWLEVTLHQHSLLHANKLVPFLTSFTSITIAQNIITTSLIVYGIWRVDRENAQFRTTTSAGSPPPSRLRKIMRIVIESGLLYTAFAILSFSAYISNSNSFYCTTDMEVQVIAIAFNLIIIRAHNQSAEEYTLPSQLSSIPLQSFRAQTSTTVTANTDQKSEVQVMVMQETDTSNYGAYKAV